MPLFPVVSNRDIRFIKCNLKGYLIRYYFLQCDTDTASILRCVTHLYDIGPIRPIVLAHDPNVLEARTDFRI